MPGIRGGRRALSEVLGALFASIAILSAAATLITLSGQAEKNLREALSQEPPLIRVARLENGSILVYNPSPRGVRIDGIVLRNGSLVQTPRKVVAPGATLLLNASDAAALVAGGRIYAIPNLTDSYPPALEPPGRCNNPLTTWATVGLGHLITYYHINTSILCNPHITNLSKTRFTISITKERYSSRPRLIFQVKYFKTTIIAPCTVYGGRCSDSFTLFSNGTIRVFVTLNATLNGDGSYNATVIYYITQKVPQGLYVVYNPYATKVHTFLPHVELDYTKNLLGLHASNAEFDSATSTWVALYYWYTPSSDGVYVHRSSSIYYSVRADFYSPDGNVSQVIGWVLYPALIFTP